MKSFIIAVVAVVLSTGVASAAVSDVVCIMDSDGSVRCCPVIIQR